MPTLLRFDGLRVVIYPNDHRPMHVHVIGAGSEAVFDLETQDGQPALRENYGFSAADTRRVRAHLAKHSKFLIDGWRRIHGASQ